jgi:hypothetical protein
MTIKGTGLLRGDLGTLNYRHIVRGWRDRTVNPAQGQSLLSHNTDSQSSTMQADE